MKKITRTMMAVLLVFCLTLSLACCSHTASGFHVALGTASAADRPYASSSYASPECASATPEPGTSPPSSASDTPPTSPPATDTSPHAPTP